MDFDDLPPRAVRYRDRHDAGRTLASELHRYRDDPSVIVLALPRGGVPVGFEVARALHAPLDVFVVRKLGVPGHEELAMGAIATGGITVMNEDVLGWIPITEEALEQVRHREEEELKRREQQYRGHAGAPEIRGRTVLVVDDGLATGSTMRAAVRALRGAHPKRIVVAVPVGAPDTCRILEREADEVVCPSMPEDLRAVGLWYDDFTQTEDDEVRLLLDEARQEVGHDARS